jgi:hypothetical protein
MSTWTVDSTPQVKTAQWTRSVLVWELVEMYAFQHVVMPIATEFNPDLVIGKEPKNPRL